MQQSRNESTVPPSSCYILFTITFVIYSRLIEWNPIPINNCFRLIIMNTDLSIIKEDVHVVMDKEIGNTSNDSGINSNASADSHNNESTTSNAGTRIEVKSIIIPFQALNTDGRKESTFLATSSTKTACNISGIEGSENKNTIDSEGKCIYLEKHTLT